MDRFRKQTGFEAWFHEIGDKSIRQKSKSKRSVKRMLSRLSRRRIKTETQKEIMKIDGVD